MNTDSAEQAVLSVLMDDPTASVGDIADHAGVSRPTAQKYIEKLEDEGAIVGYSVEVDPKKLDDQRIALVGIDVESERYVEVLDALHGVDGLSALYTATGDHMLMAELQADGDEDIHALISDEILALDGVTAACPTVLHERIV
ncbi:MAG: transcriptional regulator, AsnC family [halophilic archaeon J07HX64]|jgi:transcriptional regulator, AsnC family|nr:MAG: transcriptional regulator, AsnC family [halophilic archaeon J07HX64]